MKILLLKKLIFILKKLKLTRDRHVSSHMSLHTSLHYT